jgi:hypothetical protein
MYMQVRGISSEFKEAKEAHSGRRNRFLFAMAMIRLFTVKPALRGNLLGIAIRRYAVFPDREEAAEGNRQTPSSVPLNAPSHVRRWSRTSGRLLVQPMPNCLSHTPTDERGLKQSCIESFSRRSARLLA